MVKRFLIICVCVCCIVTVMGLGSHRFNYEGVQAAASRVVGSADIVKDDYNLIALLSYYWSDRLVVDYTSNENIIIDKTVIYTDPDDLSVYSYAINYTYQKTYYDENCNFISFENYRDEYLIFTDERSRDRAFEVIDMVFDNSRNLPGALDENTVLGNIAYGIIFIYYTIAFVAAFVITILYFLFDVVLVGLSLIKEVFWVLGFI